MSLGLGRLPRHPKEDLTGVEADQGQLACPAAGSTPGPSLDWAQGLGNSAWVWGSKAWLSCRVALATTGWIQGSPSGPGSGLTVLAADALGRAGWKPAAASDLASGSMVALVCLLARMGSKHAGLSATLRC